MSTATVLPFRLPHQPRQPVRLIFRCERCGTQVERNYVTVRVEEVDVSGRRRPARRHRPAVYCRACWAEWEGLLRIWQSLEPEGAE